MPAYGCRRALGSRSGCGSAALGAREQAMESKRFRQLVALLNDLPPVQREALLAALQSKVSPAAALKLIESRFEASPACCHCGSVRVGGWSSANRTKRYRCKDCGRTFNAFTGTPLAQLHRRESWLAYGRALSEGASLRKAAKRCGITLDTSFRWRHRLLKAAAKAPRDAVAGGASRDETSPAEAPQGVESNERNARRAARSFHPEQACDGNVAGLRFGSDACLAGAPSDSSHSQSVERFAAVASATGPGVSIDPLVQRVAHGWRRWT